ncbi:MAG: alpha/beta hydrolase [Lachnospiraceae bacterium]|nr:alpha/beta hydrolase [Lachnospiraceae bacterium]
MKDFIPENDLIEFFSHDGKEFLDARRHTGKLAVAPGKEIYYELYWADRIFPDTALPENTAENIFSCRQDTGTNRCPGALILCHGYTETCTKYHELIYYFLRRGYHVLTYDHRGHGRSFREVENPHKIHVKDFDAEYVGDLHLLVCHVALRAFLSLPLFLYGHSMGGCIAARYMQLHPGVFSRCILSSPMFGIKTGGIPNILALALARFMKLIGRGRCYTLGQHDFYGDEIFEESATTSRVRFDRYNNLRLATPEFMLGGGDYYWLYTALHAAARAVSKKETKKIKAPLLLFEAENDTYVPRRRIAAFRKNLPFVQYHAWRGTKHEIYNSKDRVLKAYYREIFRFLA